MNDVARRNAEALVAAFGLPSDPCITHTEPPAAYCCVCGADLYSDAPKPIDGGELVVCSICQPTVALRWRKPNKKRAAEPAGFVVTHKGTNGAAS